MRRKFDEEGDAEFAELLLENGLMMTRTNDIFDPQYIGHDEWILQELYVEPIQVFPILHEKNDVRSLEDEGVDTEI